MITNIEMGMVDILTDGYAVEVEQLNFLIASLKIAGSLLITEGLCIKFSNQYSHGFGMKYTKGSLGHCMGTRLDIFQQAITFIYACTWLQFEAPRR